jgi:GTPase SAR1 family protein
MINRVLADIKTDGLLKRDAYYSIERFIDDEKCYLGKILVLYGLRRTGKTTLMEQIISNKKDEYNCAFYQIEKSDSINDVKQLLINEKKKGTNLICLDEITLADDFIEDSAALSDVFAKAGMNIIVSGTDSLGFNFAEDSLYDRTVRIHTTYIPFAEHCRVLCKNDIDEYIQYGGLMSAGVDESRINSYEDAIKYLDSSVSSNIVNSLKKSPEIQLLSEVSKRELHAVIEKIVEKYSGTIDKKVVNNELKKIQLNYAADKLVSDYNISDDIYRSLLKNKDNIVKDFASIIKADLVCTFTDEVILELENYLIQMDVLSSIPKITYRYTDGEGWHTDSEKKECYIIQPAIKYNNLKKGIDFIKNEEYYTQLTLAEKEYMQQKLDEKIKGDMTEQIVIFDTRAALLHSQYKVFKPEFNINGKKAGEYDMLIYDTENNQYWAFEIKHSIQSVTTQTKHLQNETIKEIVDENWGNREVVAVLYRGKTFKSDSNTYYINITDFSLAINQYRDIKKAMHEICFGLCKDIIDSQITNDSMLVHSSTNPLNNNEVEEDDLEL